jgi:hypothetical protein
MCIQQDDADRNSIYIYGIYVFLAPPPPVMWERVTLNYLSTKRIDVLFSNISMLWKSDALQSNMYPMKETY